MIPLQIVELTAYGGFCFASLLLFLFDCIEKSSTFPTAIISGLIFCEL
jgi:hypothetical protein